MRKLSVLILIAIVMVTLMTIQALASSLLPFNSKWTVNDVKQLIASGADVNEKDKNGLTPLMAASKNCKYADILETLLYFGAKVNDRDKSLWTPLMYAIRYNSNPDIAELLIKKGSAIDGKLGNDTLLQYCAMYYADTVIYDALISVGAKEPDSFGNFQFDPDTGTITKYTARESRLEVPSTIAGVEVRRIGAGSFNDLQNAYDFEMGTNRLPLKETKGITIPNNVTSIGEGAFSFCRGLEEINVDSDNPNYRSIDGVLFDKGITKIICYPCGKTGSTYTIPSSVTSIGDYAFYDSYYLTNITIPNSVTSIGDYALYSCNNFTNITIPNSVTSIGESAFSFCPELMRVNVDSDNSYYRSIDGVLFDKDITKIIRYPAGKSDLTYTIPSSVTSIGDYAFYSSSLTNITIPEGVIRIDDCAFLQCRSLANIKIPDSVTYIGKYAFEISGLKSVRIPNNVTSIGEGAFSFCQELASINVDSISPYYRSIDGVLFDKGITKIICYPPGKTGSTYTIPSSVTSIGDYAFTACNNLEDIIIPNSVTGIDDYAFYFSGVKNIIIPNSVTRIGNYAFHGSEFTSITVPSSVTSIGDCVFSLCGNLTNISIPNSVTSIGDYAFAECFVLTSISIPNSVTSIGDYAFYSCLSLTSITIPNSVTSVGTEAFAECSELASINVDSISPNYRSIDGVLFDKDITKIIRYPAGKSGSTYTIPSSVTSIGDYAFTACNNLEDIIIPNSVTGIGDYAFASCNNLEDIIIPNSVTDIGDYAFYGSSLTNITIPNSVTSIGDYAFHFSGLTSITVPNSVTIIGDYTFYGSSLTNITIPDSVTYIGDGAFHSCRSLTSVTIPDSVTYIGDGAFSNCYNLTNITIPDSVTYIGDGAFEGNANLVMFSKNDSYSETYATNHEIQFRIIAKLIVDQNSGTILGKANESAYCNIPEYYENTKVTSIGNRAFSYSYDIEEAIIEEGLTRIEEEAFFGCGNLTSIAIPSSVVFIADSAFYGCDRLTIYCLKGSYTEEFANKNGIKVEYVTRP